MPKQKASKKSELVVSRTPVKVKTSTALWWRIPMFGLLIVGVVWIVLWYLIGGQGVWTWLDNLDAWNYAISFGCLILGLLMLMRWR